jgi:magnesium transporter
VPFPPSSRPLRQVRVVLSSTALLSFVPSWKASALALSELSVSAFFIVGILAPVLGWASIWMVIGMFGAGILVRSIDIESWGLFIPGGLAGRVRSAFGPNAGAFAAAAALSERILLAVLAAAIVGRYGADLTISARTALDFKRQIAADDLSALISILLVGAVWLAARAGRDLDTDLRARCIWVATAIFGVAILWGSVVTVRGLAQAGGRGPSPSLSDIALGLGLALPLLGGGDALIRSAHELPPPRIQALRRTRLLMILVAAVLVVAPAWIARFHFDSHQTLWVDTPLLGVSSILWGPFWASAVARFAISAAALLMLAPAVQAALGDATQQLRIASNERMVPGWLGHQHPQFGTFFGAVNVAAGAAVLILIPSSARVPWLARAYAVSLTITLLLRIAALGRLRRANRQAGTYVTPWNFQIGRRLVPVGLWLVALVALAGLASALFFRNPPTLITAGGILLVGAAFLFGAQSGESVTPLEAADVFELLPSSELVRGQVDAKPGNVLVTIRNPHALAHVASALKAAADRDVVVMTVRVIGVDADEDGASETAPTPVERRLFTRVIALAEQMEKPVRLMIVPSHDVFEAIVTTVIRLKSSEVYVGESATLSAADQARLMGDAWEAAEKTESLAVRLVIYHNSGRTDAYHLGAHPPALGPGDLELIHRIWLDAVKAVGPQVHHHDVVRAALTQMEKQLTDEQRDGALAAIRQAARPADELADAVRARDFPRLRDIARNRHAADLAEMLTKLAVEDQVVTFRVLPRKDAAAVFEYLPLDSQDTLLKSMGHEDVAALLNQMAPDDRTMFLEELPAAATRQLLSLLTPAQRSVAMALLGYPEGSIGRLMTPSYVAVREDWTVRQVLDHIRSYGQDSETLDVIYVVDQQGLLVDDIRLRELLLTSPENHVHDLMDHRFIALKATDDQQTAVSAFRSYDRTALPVTDTAGMLIGIVTIDDVLDVAEATATKEIQRIGGSEALDEPYMEIAFWRMIRKRGSWLTALFLGELLTATAMGAFEAEISKAVVLAMFIPLIISSGGNSGSQASTLVIRALALGEVGLKDWWRVMRREIFAGLALGALLGTIGFMRISIWSTFSNIYGEHWLLVGITVALALLGIVMWGTLIGSLLPFILRRFGFDPATSSAPFVATLVDVTGLVIYFSVALVILRGTLL